MNATVSEDIMPERKARSPRILIGLVILAIAAVGIILVADQFDKWSCNEPDGLWVESPDRCIDLP